MMMMMMMIKVKKYCENKCRIRIHAHSWQASVTSLPDDTSNIRRIYYFCHLC